MVKQTSFMRRTFTSDDVLEAMTRFDETMRSKYPKKRWKTYAIEHSGKLYPPKDTMRLIIGIEDIGSGGEPVNSKFQDLGFKIVSMGGPPEPDEEDVTLEALETSISLERDLEDYLSAGLSQLEAGLKPYSQNGAISRQFDTKTVGIIDLLAQDAKGKLVVIELKAGEADDRVCGQIQRYMSWVKENFAGRREVRGIIVANAFTNSLRYASRVVPGLSLKKYSVSFKFLDG